LTCLPAKAGLSNAFSLSIGLSLIPDLNVGTSPICREVGQMPTKTGN